MGKDKLPRYMYLILIFLFIIGTVSSCQQNAEKKGTLVFSAPRSGAVVPLGDSIHLGLDIPEGVEVDSIQYFIGDSLLGSTLTNERLSASTEGHAFGKLLITAIPYSPSGASKKITTNIVVVPNQAPVEYGFTVRNTYPHDPHAYTQGLEINKGILYESTGEYGQSSLRTVDLKTGKVTKKVDLPEDQFGEGMTIVDDKIIQLTWREGIGIVYDKNSFEKLKTFPYQASQEGWGLCFDGKRLIKSDGTSRLYFLDKDNYRETGSIEVYSDQGPVDSINELEYIDGKIYANIYMTDYIVIINPDTGMIEGQLNLIGLLPQSHQKPDTNVLNGIAYDHSTNKLYVTGKNWDTLFEIDLLEH